MNIIIMGASAETESVLRDHKQYEILNRLQDINDLPTLPTVFLNVMRIMRDPNTPIKEIAQVAECDPAISMKILKLINSSFYGLARTIDSVQQAIVLLGANTLKNVVISISIFKAMGGKGEESLFDREAFWQHSIGCGLIARYIGNRLGMERDEQGFIAGVIHDIGKVVLDKYFHEELTSIIRLGRRNSIPFHQAEREVIGTTHAEIGAFLAANWKLPDNLVNVIAKHHQLDARCDHAVLTALVQLSDMLAHKYKVGSGGDDLLPEIDPKVWQILNVRQSELDSWQDDLQTEITKSKELQELMLK